MKTYPCHNKRVVRNLDGVWNFAFLGEDVDLDENALSSLLKKTRLNDSMTVPSAIDTMPDYTATRGTFVLSTDLYVTPGTKGRLHFGGLGMWCRIMVDGVSLGDISLPYSGFWIDVPSSSEEMRNLTVIIDNRFDAERVPLQHQYFDFYAYGGIFRSVEWHEYNDYCLDRAVIKAKDQELTIDIFLHGDVPDKVNLTLKINDDEVNSLPQASVSPGDTGAVVRVELSGEGLASWSPESPNLHTLNISLDNDDLIERFGIRTLSLENGLILLNGEPVKLLGYNRHEVHPQFGPALPHQQLLQDIQILKDLGCNYVRGSHYPQDQRFLDLCDEAGIMVMEESLAWQPQEEHFVSEKFCRLQETQTRLMVRNSINHPSIIMWGFFNEGRSELPCSQPVYYRLAKAIKEEDDSRFVTYATCHPFEELNYDLADIISINMYPGWYEDPECSDPLEQIVPKIRKVMDHLGKEGQGEKPFIISEIGAGAIYGWRDAHNAHWSEGFQEEYLETVINEVLENDRIAGVSLWQFCDGRTYDSPMALKRPRAFNNKGTLDEYRRPKQAYESVKALFREYADRDE
jgi:beta-glucuronidase